MTPEHKIQNDIMAALSKHGCMPFRINVGSGKTKDGRFFSTGAPKGYPDISGHRKADGKAIYIEVKQPKGRVRPDQKKFGKAVENDHVLYGVCRSVEDALKVVNYGRVEDETNNRKLD